MNTLEFNFSNDTLNRLFPFYILIDETLKIKSFGKSLSKICPQIENSFSFTDCFEINRPHIENPTFHDLVFNSNQLTVIKCKKTDMSLRGQFELIDDRLLFVGSPWFQSMHQVVEKKLTLRDFALHDPLLDLLHVLNNQENTSNELKELLTTINNQKNKLKIANKEIHDIALFPMQNPDPLIRIDIEGNLLKRNPSAEKLESFEYENILYSPEDFFKFIIKKIDLEKERWIFETKNNNKDFSFVCKTLKEEGYVNIYGREITEQKLVQEELSRLSLVASSNENAVIFTEIDGTIKWANNGYSKMIGYPIEEIIGENAKNLGNGPLVEAHFFEPIIEAKKNSKSFDVEIIHYRKYGSWFWGRSKGQPLFDKDGNVKEYFAFLEDITEKKNIEEELKRLSLVASANENGIVFTKPNGTIFWCNDAYLKLTGYAKEDVIGKTPVQLGKTETTDLDELQKMITPFYKGEPFDVELNHARKDGTSFWSKNKGQPILNSKGEVTQFFAMIEDISLKKRYDESLQIEKEKYRNIIANMNLGLIEVNDEDEITLVNQSFCDISGYTQEELLGIKAANLLLTQESKELVKSKEKIRKKGVTHSYEVKVIDKYGQNKHWLISGAPNYDINGKVIGSIGIHLDITEQKEQEEKLYLLSLIAEKNINAVIVTDAKGKMEWANKSFFDMSGYTMDEIIGKKPGHLLQGKETNPETVNYMKDRIDKGLPFNCEIINYSKKGEKYWISVQGQALYNKKGEILKFFAIEENITKKKELEQQREFLVESLAKSNKELEDYAAIVSHDLKSPLRSIHSLISWIKEDNDKQLNEQTTQYLSMIEGKVEKMDYLIEGILTYAKIDKVDVVAEKVNTQEIIENIINIIHIPSHISVTINGKLPIIGADKFRVQQLFQNIISNAVNYIDKPIGTVEVSCEESAKNFIFSIKDNGPGIAKENQEKIFKIFQSLGNSDKSTGLGLSIVKKIIDTYNGEIWIESEVGQGTTFFIKLNK
jgi:PAS domain S-box-containing protein